MIRTLGTLLLAVLLLGACTKGDKVPSYLVVNSVDLTTSGLQGSNTKNITDGWIYVNDEFIGSWELPARIPILKEGSVTVRVDAGVKRNGFYDDRIRYPFYTPWIGTAELIRTTTTTVAPVVNYTEPATFWIEGFEDAGFSFLVADSLDHLERYSASEYPDLTVDGTAFGGFGLDQSNPTITLYSDQDFGSSGGAAFLEMNYRSNVDLEVGLFYVLDGAPQSSFVLGVSRSDRAGNGMIWKKIYIDLSPAFNVAISQRDIYIKATLPSDQASGTVYLDNIKLVR